MTQQIFSGKIQLYTPMCYYKRHGIPFSTISRIIELVAKPFFSLDAAIQTVDRKIGKIESTQFHILYIYVHLVVLLRLVLHYSPVLSSDLRPSTDFVLPLHKLGTKQSLCSGGSRETQADTR